MIKYAEIDGYANCGEAAPFSHLYQFMENGKETPMTIDGTFVDLEKSTNFTELGFSDK